MSDCSVSFPAETKSTKATQESDPAEEIQKSVETEITTTLDSKQVLEKIATKTAIVIDDASKDEVMKEIRVILAAKAFAFDISFDQVAEFFSQDRDTIYGTKTRASFIRAINSSLKKFGISHIRLRRPVLGGSEDSFTEIKNGRRFEDLGSPSLSLSLDKAILTVPSFQISSYNNKLVRNLMAKVVDSKTASLIIDLRNNTGGNVRKMKDFFSYFLSNNTIIGKTARPAPDGKLVVNLVTAFGSSRGQKLGIFSGQVEIWISRKSASCAEHFAIVMKELLPCRVTIVGDEPSAGKVRISHTDKFKDQQGYGWEFIYPFAEVLTPLSKRMDDTGRGIIPERQLNIPTVDRLSTAWTIKLIKS